MYYKSILEFIYLRSFHIKGASFLYYKRCIKLHYSPINQVITDFNIIGDNDTIYYKIIIHNYKISNGVWGKWIKKI